MEQNCGVFRLCAFADEAAADRAGQIRALRVTRMSLLVIRIVDGVSIADLPEETARRFREELDEAGIRVWSIGSPAGKSDIHADFGQEERRFERLLRMAEIFDASCIRLFSFYGTGGEERYFPEVCRRVETFVRMATDAGVIPCHENEKGIWGDTAPRCRALHEAVPGLRAVFDPANFVQCGQDVMQAWEALSPFVYYGHIKDCNAAGQILPPGDGIGALRQYLPLLAAKAGDTVLTLEPHLADFVGLAGLEEDGDRSAVGQVMRFPDNRAAFDYAADCLRGILSDINV